MDEDKIVDLTYDESPMEAYSGHLSVNPLTEESVVVGESADGKRKVIARNASTILPEATHRLPSKLDRQRLKELWGMDLRDPETYKRFNEYYRNEDGSINWHRFNFNPYIGDRFVSMRNPERMAKIRNAVKGGGDIAGAFGAAVLAAPLVLEAAPLPAFNRLGQSAVGQTAKVMFDPYTIPGAITNSALTAPFTVDMMNNGVNAENAVGVGLGALPYAGPAIVRAGKQIYSAIPSNKALWKFVERGGHSGTADLANSIYKERMQNYTDMYQDALRNQQALNAERTALEGELKSQFSTSPRFRSVVGQNPQSYWTRFDPTTGKFMLKTDGPVSDQFVQRDLLLNLENSYSAEMSDIRNAARQATRNFSKRWGNNGATGGQYQSVTVHTMPEHGEDLNTDYTQQKIASGLDKAKRFLNSKVREDALKHNIELAKRLGFRDIDVAAAHKDANRLSKNPHIRITNDLTKNPGGVEIWNYDHPEADVISINLATSENVENTAFHEQLHRGGYGAQGVLKNSPNSTSFYKLKSDKLKLPWDQQPPGYMRDYIDNPGEMAVNMVHYGQDMGIPLGAKYPGNTEFLKMIFDYYRKVGNTGKTWLMPYLNWKKPKRIWDALSGQYFSVPLGVGIGYETLENQNKESN